MDSLRNSLMGVFVAAVPGLLPQVRNFLFSGGLYPSLITFSLYIKIIV